MIFEVESYMVWKYKIKLLLNNDSKIYDLILDLIIGY